MQHTEKVPNGDSAPQFHWCIACAFFSRFCGSGVLSWCPLLNLKVVSWIFATIINKSIRTNVNDRYKRDEIGVRTAAICCGIIISNAFGALLASGILEGMNGILGHAAWR